MSTDTRDNFETTWLVEMPMSVGNISVFAQLVSNIKEKINLNYTVITISNDLYKINGLTSLLYWYQFNDEIILAIELEKAPQGLLVSLVGKNEKFKNKPPFAYNLYDAILKDQKEPIKLLNDDKLSDDGYKLWQKLFNLGHKITVYDGTNPTKTFKTFDSSEDFDNYFGNKDMQRYRFVLTESGSILGDLVSLFEIYYFKKLSGLI